jgi:CrcB protein
VISWPLLLSIALGGALGAVARFGIQKWIPVRGPKLPLGVLLINVVGSLIAGAVLALMIKGHVSVEVGAVIITGFCGGFTTLSTFAVETVELFRVDAWKTAYLNIILTVVGGVGLALAAFVLTKTLL